MLTPQTATLHSPRQNAVPLLEQLLSELAVTFFGRDGDGERNQVQAPLHGLIHILGCRSDGFEMRRQIPFNALFKRRQPRPLRGDFLAERGGVHGWSDAASL